MYYPCDNDHNYLLLYFRVITRHYFYSFSYSILYYACMLYTLLYLIHHHHYRCLIALSCFYLGMSIPLSESVITDLDAISTYYTFLPTLKYGRIDYCPFLCVYKFNSVRTCAYVKKHSVSIQEEREAERRNRNTSTVRFQ